MENPLFRIFLLAPTFLSPKKRAPSLGWETDLHAWGGGPPGTGTAKQESQGGLIPSGTSADVLHNLILGLGAAAAWPFLPGASACGIAAKGQKVVGGGRRLFQSCASDMQGSSHVTLRFCGLIQLKALLKKEWGKYQYGLRHSVKRKIKKAQFSEGCAHSLWILRMPSHFFSISPSFKSLCKCCIGQTNPLWHFGVAGPAISALLKMKI